MTEKPAVPDGDSARQLRGAARSGVERADRARAPSGTVIATFRVSVPRARTTMTAGSVQTVDWVDCTAWSSRCRRTVAAWAVGDQVEVTGALRRRFFRGGDGSSTRLEVEVLGARRARSCQPPG